mmetsp:Transcript_4886/g.7366  ORF Transcript_4886/g.7366 Transcript_4886/m.7366 type:complete len:286 (-) Transcript_4886:50-907(-)|eukprot:CAMPEP_0113944724 /NCGR_PEP_ID=MMETSP1339-20121228/36173_1 /TAXON_ID=94617 /ORGANISM="Fibrocapsa japonica" /LENGTH=285 /DNA_ID=CAMNT_0000950023 /DNA_START=31 /DNA_END=888 /DNA_ORIENTATION=+ /assembly_acc=CAM_ASM_000762
MAAQRILFLAALALSSNEVFAFKSGPVLVQSSGPIQHSLGSFHLVEASLESSSKCRRPIEIANDEKGLRGWFGERLREVRCSALVGCLLLGCLASGVASPEQVQASLFVKEPLVEIFLQAPEKPWQEYVSEAGGNPSVATLYLDVVGRGFDSSGLSLSEDEQQPYERVLGAMVQMQLLPKLPYQLQLFEANLFVPPKVWKKYYATEDLLVTVNMCKSKQGTEVPSKESASANENDDVQTKRIPPSICKDPVLSGISRSEWIDFIENLPPVRATAVVPLEPTPNMK